MYGLAMYVAYESEIRLIQYAVTTCAKFLATNVLPLFTRVPYNDVTEWLHVPR